MAGAPDPSVKLHSVHTPGLPSERTNVVSDGSQAWSTFGPRLAARPAASGVQFRSAFYILGDEHVIDPDAGNDSASTPFSVTVTDGVVPEPKNRTGDVVLTSLKSSYSSIPEAGAPGGVHTITAKWRNNSGDTLFDVFFDVTTLTGPACPCVLLNADGGPGGVGSDRSVPNAELPGGDNLWQPDEVTGEITFRLGLTVRKPVTFFVDLWATAAAE